MGVTIRHYFNTMHAGKPAPNWTWLATAAIFVVIMWLSTFNGPEPTEEAQLSRIQQQFASAQGFEDVTGVVTGRCSMCHARGEVFWPGVHRAPKGVTLETEADIAEHAREIYLQAGRSHAMPPGNVSEMEPAERRMIVEWYERAVASES